jgi:peptide/nickel transport system substrate-binding protein
MSSKLKFTLFVGAAAGLAALFTVSASSAADYKEAPALAAEVAAGKLPPVAKRLPDEPIVVHPLEKVGTYGGTWRLSMAAASDVNTLVRSIGYENLTRFKTWSPDQPQKDIVPQVEMNVAKSVDVTEGGKIYTFHLRPGLKWSDGQPYTAADIMFWYKDVMMNTELAPSKPVWAMRGGKPMEVEKVDDYTVRFKFAEPSGLLLEALATPALLDEPNVPTAYPAHYLKQFHKAYVSDIDAVARANRAQGWVQLFHAKADAWRNPDVPRLNPWIVTSGIGQDSSNKVTAKRNPYYFKVDTAGNQLPYMDDVSVEIVGDQQVMLLKSANGDFDMVDSYIGFVTTPENKAVFADNQERGKYDFYEVIPNRANLMIISLNLTTADPVKNGIYNNLDFRHALSMAINRDEIIDLVFLGQGRPYQVVERPESPLFDEQMATQYTRYDPKAANELLDKAGFAKKNADGIRLGPDGNPLRITMDISVLRRVWIDSAELIKRYWRAVGIELFINTMDNTALNQRVQKNEHDAAVWSASGGADTLFDPKYFFPTSWTSFYAPTWGQYYAKGPRAQEPSAPAKEQMALFDKVLATPDVEQRMQLLKSVFRIAKEQFWTIGIVQPTTDYGIINKRLKNVPNVMLASTMYTHPGAANPEQFYFAK